jgi:hypothetical protein
MKRKRYFLVWLEVGGIEGIFFYDREEAIDWLLKK